MKPNSVVLCLGLSLGLLVACGAADDPDLVGESTADIVIGCGNQPPCDCALRGTPVCADPDQDGVPNLDDNCDATYNPNQANCDGDGNGGDVCDADNSTVYSQNVGVSYGPIYSGGVVCTKASNGQIVCFQRLLQDVTYTTYLMVQYCGLSGNGYEDRTYSTVETVQISP